MLYDFYDYIIIGGGPSGLTLAWYLSKIGKTCVIVDREAALGGCHRVRRVPMADGQRLFTEHGPRVYSEAFLTFRSLLCDMNMDFYSIFKPYNFTIGNIGVRTVTSFTLAESLSLFGAFASLVLDSEFGKDTSMEMFMNVHKFSQASRDYIDRLCLLTDGGDSRQYTLFKFLQLVNQQLAYRLYQPAAPNDELLVKGWTKALEATGLVDTLTSVYVKYLSAPSIEESSGKVAYEVDLFDFPSGGKRRQVAGSNLILAIPPVHIQEILARSTRNPTIQRAFGDQFCEYAQRTRYTDYICISMHWKTKQEVPAVWGFPASDWGVVFVMLSDYMKLREIDSTTMLSLAISRPDALSSVTQKTAHQSSWDELKVEVLRQVRTVFPNVVEPTHIILSPEIYRDEKAAQWKSRDTAFIAIPRARGTSIMKYKSPRLPSLYMCGTQNEQNAYAFTSIESAVANAVELVRHLHPETNASQVRGTTVVAQVHTLGFILLLFFILFVVLVCTRRLSAAPKSSAQQ